MPIVLVPSLILLDHTLAFLAVTTIFLTFRSYWFFKNIKRFDSAVDEKIFDAFNILFWIVIQASYVISWITEKILEIADLGS